MTTHIGLLRAINLAGINRVGMADLRALVESLGMREPDHAAQQRQRRVQERGRVDGEARGAARTGGGAAVEGDHRILVRTAAEWKAIIAANPFPKEAKADPGHLLMLCLKTAPDRDAVVALQKAIKGREQVRVTGRDAFITYPDGVGRSKLTATLNRAAPRHPRHRAELEHGAQTRRPRRAVGIEFEAMRIDINSDTGESFGAYTIGHDAGLMRSITSANVAAGFHAGDPSVLRATIRLAKAHGVAVGAHPGFPDLVGFGRRELNVTPQEAEDFVLYQIAAVAGVAAAEGVKLQHVKPHGALFNMAVRNRGARRRDRERGRGVRSRR